MSFDRDWIEDVRVKLNAAESDLANALHPKALGRLIDATKEIVNAMATEREKRDESDDGWIPWTGGECPVSPTTRVDVQFRNGGIEYDETAEGWLWRHNGDDGDIVAYRITRNDNTEPDKLHELSQMLDRQDETITELEADNRWMAKKLAELERENERLRKHDIRIYIPHPDKWPESSAYVDMIYRDFFGRRSLITAFSRNEARRLHEPDDR